MIKVGVLGARGRMGAMVCDAVRAAGDMELSATVDKGDPREPLAGCDAVVDFTHPGAVMENLRWCLSRGLTTIVGTSGFDEERLSAVRGMLGDPPGARALIVPNFSVGAVLMMRFAQQAARYFESAEVIELHHAAKADAPSGTASRTASVMAGARAAAGARRRPSRSDAARCARGAGSSGPWHRPPRTPRHGPCAGHRRDRGTCPAHRSAAGGRRRRRWPGTGRRLPSGAATSPGRSADPSDPGPSRQRPRPQRGPRYLAAARSQRMSWFLASDQI